MQGTPLGAVLPQRYHDLFRHASLNAVQSAVAADVLRSDKNIVVAAPTASGKTTVFELALVRMIQTCPGGKALFLAPMKSICNERLADWSARFAPHGLAVSMLTGDTDGGADDEPASPRKVIESLSSATVIVATTEKWDVWTRTHRDVDSVIGQIALLCVDEVHMLGEKRGPVIEAVVSRMRSISKLADLADLPIARLRVLALSATMANPRTLCDWLGEDKTIIHSFDGAFRPTPLSVTVTGFRASIQARFEQDTLLPALPRAIREHTSGRPTLVFFASRKLSVDGALKLAGSSGCAPSAEARAAADCAELRGSPQLAQLLRAGVGYHVASMSADERRIVEGLFVSGRLSILCATAGLSLGVNLPAHLVVICGTSRWCGSSEGYVDYSNSDILQMAGRAGRPQFDTEGRCVVLTTEAGADKYRDLVNGVVPICSQLHLHLGEHLNAEINTASYMTSAEVALGFLKSTFLYQCVLDASLRHHFNLARDADQQHLDTQLEGLCVKELRQLSATGLIRLGDSGAIEPQPAGKIAAHYAVKIQSMALVVAELTARSSVRELIGILARCAELHDPLRRAERKPLHELNKAVRYPLLDAKMHVAKVGDVALKTNVLLQAACGGEVRDGELLAAVAKVAKEGQRILVAVAELAHERGFFDSLLHAHTLARCLARGAGWGDSPNRILTQLPGIGEVLSDRLVAVGLTSIKAIASARPAQLEGSCFKAAPFGAELAGKALRVPEIAVWARRDEAAAQGDAAPAALLSVGITCVRAPISYSWRDADAKFTLLVGSTLDATLALRKSVTMREQDQEVSFVLPARAVAGRGALRVCVLHNHYVGADLEGRLELPWTARAGVQAELAMQPIPAPPPPPHDAPAQPKAAAKPRAQQRPPPQATSRKRASSAAAGPSTADAQWRSPPARAPPPQAGTSSDRFATPAAAAPPPGQRGEPERGDDAMDAFFEQFKHTDEVDTPPPKLARASRLEPPRELAGHAPRLLGGLAARASSGGSASDLIAQLRSTISSRSQPPQTMPPAPLPPGAGLHACVGAELTARLWPEHAPSAGAPRRAAATGNPAGPAGAPRAPFGYNGQW